MYADLKGKKALVMGVSKQQGIGFSIARELVGQGVSVYIADHDGAVFERARDLEAEGGTVRALQVDVRSMEQLASLRAAVGEEGGTLDILIQCVGVMPEAAKLADAPAEEWLRTQDINVNGTFRLLQTCIPLMRDHGGSIVAIASGAGKRPLSQFSSYSVSKAALIMMLKCVAVEYACDKIRANTICPGPVESDMVEVRVMAEAALFGESAEMRSAALCKGIPLGRMARFADIAATAVFLASDASSYLTGQSINLSGGMITEL